MTPCGILGVPQFIATPTGLRADKRPIEFLRRGSAGKAGGKDSGCDDGLEDLHFYAPSASKAVAIASHRRLTQAWPAAKDHDWYDVTVTLPGMEVRLAGRIERGTHSISDPLASG